MYYRAAVRPPWLKLSESWKRVKLRPRWTKLSERWKSVKLSYWKQLEWRSSSKRHACRLNMSWTKLSERFKRPKLGAPSSASDLWCGETLGLPPRLHCHGRRR